MNDLQYLVLSALLTWLMLLCGSLYRARAWTPVGMKIAFGNRDEVLELAPSAGRLDRAARNMLENLVLFVAVLVAARLHGATAETLSTGAAIFFWARVAYAVVYVAGITYVRTLIWAVSLAGLAMIARQAF